MFAAGPVRAEEPSGCDKFKWPIDDEQAALASPDKRTVEDGGALVPGKAVVVHLAPVDNVHFQQPPQRPPAPDSTAAMLKLPSPQAGVYTVSLSAGAWIDVIQGGVQQKPLGFSGARDCPNIHKTLKFRLSAEDVTIQISGFAAPEISLVVMPK
jgi:hypothetical protein